MNKIIIDITKCNNADIQTVNEVLQVLNKVKNINISTSDSVSVDSDVNVSTKENKPTEHNYYTEKFY